MIMHKKIARVCIGLVIGLCIGISFLDYSDSKQPVIGQHTNYADYLQDCEAKAWSALNDVGITWQECQKHKSGYIDELKQDARIQKKNRVSKKTETLVRTVLRDFGVNQNSMSIEPFDDITPAAANEVTVYINESLFKNLPLDAQYFVIGHEIQHTIHEDAAIENSINAIGYQKEKKGIENVLNEYSRFTEERADIKAALKNERYAKGYVSFMNKEIQKNGENAGISHPKNSKRLLMAQDILQSKYNIAIKRC